MDRRYKQKMERYWARELKRAKATVDKLDFSKWFDLWHTHPDWESKGNRYPESRVAVAKATYDLLLYSESASASRSEPIQIFAQVCEDTGSNAVYIHTENPNGTEFPCQFENTEWSAEAPPELVGVVNLKTHEIGRTQYESESIYVIRKRA